jgi:Protein of unknown function (DUF4232)
MRRIGRRRRVREAAARLCRSRSLLGGLMMQFRDLLPRRFVAVFALVTGLALGCQPTTPPPSASAPPSIGPSIGPSIAPSLAPSPSQPTVSPSSSALAPSASTSAGAACSAADLSVTGGPWGGAAGSRGTDISVKSNAGAACELPASPAVVALDAGGAVVAQGAVGAVGAGPAIQPGANAAFSLQFSNWCNQSVRLPLHFALLLVSGSAPIDQLAINSADELPPCNGPGQPPTLSTTAWES